MKKVYYEEYQRDLVKELEEYLNDKYEFIYLLDNYIESKNQIVDLNEILNISWNGIPYSVINNVNSILIKKSNLYLKTVDKSFMDYFITPYIEIYNQYRGFLPKAIEDILSRHDNEIRYRSNLDNDTFSYIAQKASNLIRYTKRINRLNQENLKREDIKLLVECNKEMISHYPELKEDILTDSDYNYFRGISDVVRLIEEGYNSDIIKRIAPELLEDDTYE